MGKDYLITEHSYRKAKELGVEIKPAENKHKKIDVFKNGKYVTTIGSKNYKDYGTYLAMEERGEVPKGYSAERRRLYKQRHRYDKGDAGFFANRILW